MTDPTPYSYRPVAWTTDQAHIQIEQTWSDDLYAGVSGFALVRTGVPQDLVILCEGQAPGRIEWMDRADVYASFPDYPRHVRCGFRAWFLRRAKHEITLRVPAPEGGLETTLRMDGTGFPPFNFPEIESSEDMETFARRVNRDCRTVLEIGSRVVSPGSSSKRSFFSERVNYTGFDFYPDSNTDVVGDAHRLSSYFAPDQRFDAIFSLSVLEHIAMPWLVAMEINRMLPIGGLTFHSTVFTWPLHESPWDFWRFTHEGLKVLFNPAMGFEIEKAGLSGRSRIHCEGDQGLAIFSPDHPTWGESHILARKVAELPMDRFRWNVGIEEALANGSHYPKPAGK